MAKDKRMKGCPNTECSVHKGMEKLKAEDMYCPKCGETLIYVCASKKCYKQIEDLNYNHRFCASCEVERNQRFDELKDGAGKAGGVVLGVAVAAGAAAKGVLEKEVTSAAKDVAKDVAKQVVKKVKK